MKAQCSFESITIVVVINVVVVVNVAVVVAI